MHKKHEKDLFELQVKQQHQSIYKKRVHKSRLEQLWALKSFKLLPKFIYNYQNNEKEYNASYETHGKVVLQETDSCFEDTLTKRKKY
jgi:hypothetical protein